MTTLILGGAPGANWFPLLLPLIAILLIMISFERIKGFIRVRRNRQQ